MKRTLHIEVSTLEESLDQFGDYLQRTIQGETTAPYSGIGFESIKSLFSTLSPKRLELIEQLKRHGPMTVYALAKRLGRDYKNVYTDVKALEQWSVIERDEQDCVQVPWDEIDLKIPLAA
ncbi:MAG: HTH domain-containing protein [Candidatus Competibacteraceae bacterium]